MVKGIIYGLVGPEGIRYIGQTVRQRDRYRAHERDAENGSQLHVHRWWRTLAEPPEMVVIEIAAVADLDELEREWIAILRREGINLCNHRDGGAKGIPDDVTRARMSAAQRGRKATSETKAKLSAARIGKRHSPEWCRAIGEGLKNSDAAMSQRARLASSQVGRKRSPEARARMAAAQRLRYEQSTLEERRALTAKANEAWRARGKAA